MTLERGRSRGESVNGGNQSTDTSLIHRRCIARAASADRFGRRRGNNLLDRRTTIRVDRNSGAGDSPATSNDLGYRRSFPPSGAGTTPVNAGLAETTLLPLPL